MTRPLIMIKCRCGKTTKGFKKIIGEFYIDECCVEAGYDYKGELVQKPNNASVEEAPEDNKKKQGEHLKKCPVCGLQNYKCSCPKKINEA